MKKRKSLIEEINKYFGAAYKSIDELDRNSLISCLDDVFLWYLLLSDAYRETDENKTCKNCKWWSSFPNNITQCENKKVLEYTVIVNPIFGTDSMSFEPPNDFGCNQWETKE